MYHDGLTGAIVFVDGRSCDAQVVIGIKVKLRVILTI
jgi:hypothetical protein